MGKSVYNYIYTSSSAIFALVFALRPVYILRFNGAHLLTCYDLSGRSFQLLLGDL